MRGEERLHALESNIHSGLYVTLPLSEQRLLLTAVDRSEAFQRLAPTLARLKTLSLPRATLLEFVACLGRFGDRPDGAYLLTLLEHADPAVVAAAVQALGKVDLDALLPWFGRLLANEDPRIRGAVIKVFLRFDQAGALQQLQALADAANPRLRRYFLSLLPQFDVAAVRPLLFRFFERERLAELKTQAGYILAANPTEEGLVLLCDATYDENDRVRPEWADLWRMALDAASTLLGPDPFRLELRCCEQVAVRRRTMQQAGSTRPTGAASGLPHDTGAEKRTAAAGSGSESSPRWVDQPTAADRSRKQARGVLLDALSAWFSESPFAALGVGVLAVLLTVALMNHSWGGGARRSGSQAPLAPAGVTIPDLEVRGTVQWVDITPRRPGILVFEKESSTERFFITVPIRIAPTFKKGKRFQGKVRPYSREGRTILATLVSGE